LHLYTPLPFRPGKGGFGELFRTHFFINGGNLSNFNQSGLNMVFLVSANLIWCLIVAGISLNDNFKNILQRLRWSYGVGVVMRMGGYARMELNYCWPMSVQKGDGYGFIVRWCILHFCIVAVPTLVCSLELASHFYSIF
jgi:outer membrane protein insertion porin family